MRYNDPAKRQHGLAFNSCEDELATLRDKSDALDVLSDAVENTFDTDVRDNDLTEALTYLRQCLKRTGALNDFQQALSIQNPVDRETALKYQFGRIRELLRPRSGIDVARNGN